MKFSKVFSVIAPLAIVSTLAMGAFAHDSAEEAHGSDAHGAADHDATERNGSEHGGAEHAEGAHGAHGHHDPTFADVNWFHGFLGEKEGVEPSLLYRTPGTPIPVGALLLNTAILFFILGKVLGPAIGQGLVDRKKRIAGDIEAASKMKSEATDQLAHYEAKLADLTAEMERIASDMKKHAEVDRSRILKEAELRHEALEKEARHVIDAELAHARQEIAKNAARQAVALAKAELEKILTSEDHERLSKEFLTGLEKHVEVRS